MSSQDRTRSISPRQTASSTSPGLLSGRMSPDTTTLLSTTTRSARPSHLADCRHHVSFNLLLGPVVLAGDLLSACEKLTEAVSPLLLGYRPNVLRAEPGVHRFAHQLRYRLAPALCDPSEAFQLLLGEVDVRPLHRSYIIHHEARSTCPLEPLSSVQAAERYSVPPCRAVLP